MKIGKKLIVIFSAFTPIILILVLFVAVNEDGLSEGLTSYPSDKNSDTHQISKQTTDGNLPSSSEFEKDKEIMKDFTNEGWKEVDTSPPDHELVAFSPDLLGHRENELQNQLSSTTASIDDLPNIGKIATTTSNLKTRYLALAMLGDSPTLEAQNILISIYKQMDDESKNEILGMLRPRETSDSITSFIVDELATSSNQDQKRIALGTLAALNLAKSPQKINNELLAKLDPENRREYQAIFTRLQNPGIPHENDHEHE